MSVFWGGTDAKGRRGWVGGGGDKVGVFLSKSGPALNEAVGVWSMQMKERRRKTCCP